MGDWTNPGSDEKSQQQLSEKRTDYSEDRTVLSNERTFAGWMRTGLGAVGIGLGFQALFRQSENVVLAKLSASVFILIGLFIFWAAYHSASKVLDRLDAHSAEPVPRKQLVLVAGLFSLGSAMLLIVLWLL